MGNNNISKDCKLNMFLSFIGDEALEIFDNLLAFAESDLEKIFGKFEEYFISMTNKSWKDFGSTCGNESLEKQRSRLSII